MSIAFNTVKRQANVRSLRALTATTQIQTRSFTFTPSTAFISTRPTKMASILSSAASAAHSAVASLASVAQAKPGDSVPSAEARINDLEDKINFSTLKGKNILVTVPGAFSPTCSSQVPGYLERFDDFKAKGVEGIYVVTVNDIFVVNAWKEKINKDASSTKDVKYVADDTGAVASAFGLVLDAQAIFGGPRLKRAAVVIDNGKVVSVAVEPSPGEVTVSHADEVIKNL